MSKKCKDCKYKCDMTNTDRTGTAICSYPTSGFPINIEDNCHFINKKTALTCADCARFGEDMACIECSPEDSAMHGEKLCLGYIDKREEELMEILTFWKDNGLYDREKINNLLDDFEESYKKLTGEEP